MTDQQAPAVTDAAARREHIANIIRAETACGYAAADKAAEAIECLGGAATVPAVTDAEIEPYMAGILRDWIVVIENCGDHVLQEDIDELKSDLRKGAELIAAAGRPQASEEEVAQVYLINTTEIV